MDADIRDGQGHLKRTLGLWAVVLFGLAYMTPMIVYGTFGILSEVSHGMVPTAYLIALCAVLLTAVSYGKMAYIFPVAGSAYTYARKSIGPSVGFMVGWAVLLDYFFLPMVIWLIGAAYLGEAFPAVPTQVWLIGFIFITTVINIIGIAFASKVNFVLMVMQALIVAAFILLCIHYVSASQGAGGLVSARPFFNAEVSFSFAFAGAAIAAYSFLGFDAVTTLTEETIDPKRNMPRAIFLIALIGGAIFVTAAYFAQLAHPETTFENVSAAAFVIAARIGGDIFAAVFLIGLVVAQFASGLAAQTSVGRLLYAMGRDSVLPRSVFGYIHPRFNTPVYNLILASLVGLMALYLDVATSTSFINFGAFLAFTFVNLSVIALVLKKHEAMRDTGALTGLVVPALGVAFNLYLLVSLDTKAITLGCIWLALGAAYLAYLTRGFSRRPPEVSFNAA
ncbi:APC family permease [Rubellimicrobium aerolatum]|uniref:APC family permease n=1 Tax=Rubellimicrobium aerolatum TaxID=490979 RepID=A0ABW0SGP0_9RHOB|nr:APC family permease [Rubellimicrobium aerolatum]MBP1807443.1 amino acid transporter [Rubellimicrobium aerolatum]